jgi:hypothetical protein
VHAAITTQAMSRAFFVEFFSGPHAAEDSERSIAANIIQQKQDKVYLQITKDSVATNKSREPYASKGSRLNRVATSFVVSWMLALGSLHRLCDQPLCHPLEGELGVPAPKTCQHMLRHCLRQGTTLCLQLATADHLQLQHLGPSRVKQWECGADSSTGSPVRRGLKPRGTSAALL